MSGRYDTHRGHLWVILFFAIAPVTVAGIVPWWISRWQVDPAFFGIAPLRVLGGVLIAAGLPVHVESFARFALEGLGTPAPIAPPTHLVVRGVYRHVRNPIYVALLAIVFGQAMLLGSVDLLVYGAAVWLGFHLFVAIYEEPDLRRRFGDDFAKYRAGVPRWLPRIRPLSSTGTS